MSRSSGFASHRFLLALSALLLLGLSFATASASAATTEANCENLQEVLNKAETGDTITLTQMCTKSNSGPAAGSFHLPENIPFTLTGTPGAGFDGTGVPEAVLSGPVEGFTLSSLTVKNASTAAGAVALKAGPGAVTIRSVTFTANKSAGLGFSAGGLLIQDGGCGAPGTTEAPLTITGSTFTGNSIAAEFGVSGGGATVYAGNFKCTALRPVSITNNTFSGNSASGSGAKELVLGGGLAVLGNNKVIDPLTQSGNSFTGNAVAGSKGASNANFGGGGEWVQGMNVTSTGDSFVGNTATGSTTEGGWTWGAGLAILNTGEKGPSECNPEGSHVQGLATNLVVAGNSITGGLPADAQGTGIYTGCELASGSDLVLRDSTVSGNSSVAGGIAGIDGEAADRLTLSNTIDAGNIGGSDLGGFSEPGGINSSFSDVCLSGAALVGSGNICAQPLLASASDVHETSASPTIDAGSNALVPNGLTTDAFGTTRILAGHTGCIGSFPAVVDMGAAEFQSAAPSCLPPRPPARGLTHFVSLRTTSKGAALRLSCTSTDGLGCSGEIFLTTDETRQGKKVIAVGASKRTKRTTVSVRIGQAPFSLPAGGTATFQVKLNSTGLQLLRRFHTISAWVLANETMTNSSPVIFLLHSTLFSQPKHKHKSKHKSRHAKRRH
jgi:hypothetical protein